MKFKGRIRRRIRMFVRRTGTGTLKKNKKIAVAN